ncbi:FG-GAP repeat protein [Alteromonas gracilis]|uniref:FG-GAP repeat protein n=1 Tax=Alteromonas gracilis TaxID=1479524 RepID=UPI0030CDC2F3
MLASDSEKTDIFGVRVALSGDTALISARRDDIEGVGIDAGSAYIFERSNGLWRQTEKLTAPDGNADDRFGRGVALTTNLAVISAMHSDANANNQGELYVYEKQNGKWRSKYRALANDASEDDKFGWNVALYKNMAIVGTPYSDDNGTESGSAYILDIKKAP